MVYYFYNSALSGNCVSVCFCLCMHKTDKHVSRLVVKSWEGLYLIYYSPSNVYSNVSTKFKKE